MSGLVIGLQNRVQRFESARDLQSNHRNVVAFFVYIYLQQHQFEQNLPQLITL